jgi:DNA-binding SARP family transcriptional activator
MEVRWRIELFGQLRVGRGDAAPLPLPRQKATALLAYLAYHTHHPHAREGLIDLLWPEADLEEGRHNLRRQLYVLRELLRAWCLGSPDPRNRARARRDHFSLCLPQLRDVSRNCLDPAAPRPAGRLERGDGADRRGRGAPLTGEDWAGYGGQTLVEVPPHWLTTKL